MLQELGHRRLRGHTVAAVELPAASQDTGCDVEHSIRHVVARGSVVEEVGGFAVHLDRLPSRIVDLGDLAIRKIATELSLDPPRLLVRQFQGAPRPIARIRVDENLARPRHRGEAPDEVVLDAFQIHSIRDFTPSRPCVLRL